MAEQDKVSRERKVKIVATLGPASSSREMIENLFRAGVDVFRFNFSHGSHSDHRKNYETVRTLEKELDQPIGVLADLQGPKLRIGRFANNKIQLELGARFVLDSDEALGDQTRVHLPHPEIFASLKSGSLLLLDDGRLSLKVVSCDDQHAETVVATGGELSDNKEVNVPDILLPVSVLTSKDLADLEFVLALGADWIALSFVQRAADVMELKTLVGDKAKVLAKLEKPGAITDLDNIVDVADGVMVARGDLSVEVSPEQVPPIQKRIFRACRKHGKPVIVATQMLESMIHAPVLTRAEAGDVATAVYDGADAVMLSAETAVGEYPVKTVEIMDRIIAQVEADPVFDETNQHNKPDAMATLADAICSAMHVVADLLPVGATVTYTSSGFSTLRAARERPRMRILSLSPVLKTRRMLKLVWGLWSVAPDNLEEDPASGINGEASRLALREGMVTEGQAIVIVGGAPFGKSGTTNMLRIAWPGNDRN